MTQPAETFEQWRERTAPAPAATSNPLSVTSSWWTGLAVLVLAGACAAGGSIGGALLLGPPAFVLLSEAATQTWFPLARRRFVNAAVLVVLSVLVPALHVMHDGNDHADWFGLVLGLGLIGATKGWGIYARVRAARR